MFQKEAGIWWNFPVWWSVRLILVICLSHMSCTVQHISGRESFEPPVLNELAFVSNGYLRALAATPIYWYPWEKQALERAKREGKLLAIDIGTTACYPCQLQERFVYQDSAVVQIMNDRFVSIRVDRFERPDLARRYLTLLDSGGGGWPLQVIALPDGRPLVAGNFLTQERWLSELNKAYDFWDMSPVEAERQASGMWRKIREALALPEPADQRYAPGAWGPDAIIPALDLPNGGRPGEPKFPIVTPYLALLSTAGSESKVEVNAINQRYLRTLTSTSIYDHLGGGIMRCAEDRQWRYPCFEKTLYDNVLLLRLLAAQHRLDPRQKWVHLMEEVWAFIQRDLRGAGYGYAAALRPDSEGELGRYYVWPEIEIRAVLGDEAGPFIHAFNVKQGGNWAKGQNVLYKSLSDQDLATGYNLNVVEWQSMLETWKDRLFEARLQRVKPEQDDMQITGWQGLLVSALVESYLATGDGRWLNEGLKLADHIRMNCLRPDGSLCHFISGGYPEGDGFLSDYAFVLEAFFLLHQATLEETWINTGMELIRYLLAYHYEPATGWFISEPASCRDWMRQYDLEDQALPSAQAVLAQQLFLASWLVNKPEYRGMVRNQLASMSGRTTESPLTFASWMMLAASFSEPMIIISLGQREGMEWFRDVHRYLPTRVLVTGAHGMRYANGTGAAMTMKIGLESAVSFNSVAEGDRFLRDKLGIP